MGDNYIVVMLAKPLAVIDPHAIRLTSFFNSLLVFLLLPERDYARVTEVRIRCDASSGIVSEREKNNSKGNKKKLKVVSTGHLSSLLSHAWRL